MEASCVGARYAVPVLVQDASGRAAAAIKAIDAVQPQGVKRGMAIFLFLKSTAWSERHGV